MCKRRWAPTFSKALASADRKSTRLNSSHSQISYAVFCLKKKKYKNVLSARVKVRVSYGPELGLGTLASTNLPASLLLALMRTVIVQESAIGGVLCGREHM